MKKILTLVGIIGAIVFMNPAQAKADVSAYVYLNPLSWFFTAPVRVVEKPVYRYQPIKRKVVYAQPKKLKKAYHRAHRKQISYKNYRNRIRKTNYRGHTNHRNYRKNRVTKVAKHKVNRYERKYKRDKPNKKYRW